MAGREVTTTGGWKTSKLCNVIVKHLEKLSRVIIRKAENIPTEFTALGEEVLRQNVVGVSYLLLSTLHQIQERGDSR